MSSPSRIRPGRTACLSPDPALVPSRDDLVAEAVRSHLDVTLAAARSLLRSEDLAWDAVQETLQTLWKMGSIEGPLRAWLIRAVRLRALQALRSGRRRRRHEEACACLRCRAIDDDPSRSLEDAEHRKQLEELVLDLPTPLRVVFELREWIGLEYEAIADELEIPVGTVRSRLSRARARLREAFLARSEESVEHRSPEVLSWGA